MRSGFTLRAWNSSLPGSTLRPFRTPRTLRARCTLRSYWPYLPLRTLWTWRPRITLLTLRPLRSLRSGIALRPASSLLSLGACWPLDTLRSPRPSGVSLGSLGTDRATRPYWSRITRITLLTL